MQFFLNFDGLNFCPKFKSAPDISIFQYFIILEPMIILTWNLGEWLKLTRETRQYQKIDDYVISRNCDIIVIFLVLIQKQDYCCMVCKTYIFVNNYFFSYKNWKQNQNISNATLILFLWTKVLFLIKNADFLQKNAGISKIKAISLLKGKVFEITYVCVPLYQIMWSF